MARVLRPFGDRVILDVVKAKEVTDAGIVLTAGALEAPAEAIITAVGELVNVTKYPLGARVIYPKYAGTEITLDGVAMLVVKASEIIGVLDDAPVDRYADITQEDGSPIPEGSRRLTAEKGWELLTPRGWVPDTVTLAR